MHGWQRAALPRPPGAGRVCSCLRTTSPTLSLAPSPAPCSSHTDDLWSYHRCVRACVEWGGVGGGSNAARPPVQQCPAVVYTTCTHTLPATEPKLLGGPLALCRRLPLLLPHTPLRTWCPRTVPPLPSPAGHDGRGGRLHSARLVRHAGGALAGLQRPDLPPLLPRHADALHAVRCGLSSRLAHAAALSCTRMHAHGCRRLRPRRMWARARMRGACLPAPTPG